MNEMNPADPMLKSAEEIMAEAGVDAVTVAALAERCGQSEDETRRRFASREAVLEALGQRYVNELRTLFDDFVTPDATDQPLSRLLTQVVDGLAAYYREHPALRNLFHDVQPSRPLRESATALVGDIIDRIDEILAHHSPHLDPERRRLHARIIVTVVRALLPLSNAYEQPLCLVIPAEINRIILAYVASIMGREDPLPPPTAGTL